MSLSTEKPQKENFTKNSPLNIILFGSFIALCGGLIFSTWAILPPFLTAIGLAFIFDPTLRFLESKKIGRPCGIVFLFIGILIFLSGILLLIIPLVYHQSLLLLDALPNLITTSQEKITTLIATKTPEFLKSQTVNTETFKTFLKDHSETFAQWGKTLLNNSLSHGIAVIQSLSFVILTTLFTVYTLYHWKNFTHHLQDILPENSKNSIIRYFSEIQETLCAFVKGQFFLCASLALFYGAGLSLIGISSGLAIGVISGFLSFIPYLGSSLCLILGLLMAFSQESGYLLPILVVFIFITGQLLESYVLTPKFIGDRLGLPTLWILFALIAGGHLFGFVGMILAIPVASIFKISLNRAKDFWKQSLFYKTL